MQLRLARQGALHELAKLGAQIWMTGADPLAFADVGAGGEVFSVENGSVRRQ